MSMLHRRIVVSGMIASDPFQGGATWAVLQYLLGLRRLGHSVLFVEPIDEAKIVPDGAPLEGSVNYRYLVDALTSVGFDGGHALLMKGTTRTAGTDYAAVRAYCSTADLLLNVSGMLDDPALIEAIPTRAYLDLDPAFVQLWHAQGIDMRFDAHTHFVTVGLGIGKPECPIPTEGRDWIATLQPIVLDQWPLADEVRTDALTTIANWRGYGSVEHNGQTYGQKVHSLRELIDLPRLVDERFVLALAIHPAEVRDIAALNENGWELVDPAAVAGSAVSYRSFIQGSRAEFGVAKSGYVRSRSGWFSDRSICYLASGRPVVAHDTGFESHLPTGDGLFAFSSIDDVRNACGEIRSRYAHHRRAAREIAETHFASDRVLNRLLEALPASTRPDTFTG
jgi:hypothetical protein